MEYWVISDLEPGVERVSATLRVAETRSLRKVLDASHLKNPDLKPPIF
jgi:hypothetical protein